MELENTEELGAASVGVPTERTCLLISVVQRELGVSVGGIVDCNVPVQCNDCEISPTLRTAPNLVNKISMDLRNSSSHGQFQRLRNEIPYTFHGFLRLAARV